MDEKAGQPAAILCIYSIAILVMLLGLYVLLKGERRPDESLLHSQEATLAAVSEGMVELNSVAEGRVARADSVDGGLDGAETADQPSPSAESPPYNSVRAHPCPALPPRARRRAPAAAPLPAAKLRERLAGQWRGR